jgi:hypothetical protein
MGDTPAPEGVAMGISQRVCGFDGCHRLPGALVWTTVSPQHIVVTPVWFFYKLWIFKIVSDMSSHTGR